MSAQPKWTFGGLLRSLPDDDTGKVVPLKTAGPSVDVNDLLKQLRSVELALTDLECREAKLEDAVRKVEADIAAQTAKLKADAEAERAKLAEERAELLAEREPIEARIKDACAGVGLKVERVRS